MSAKAAAEASIPKLFLDKHEAAAACGVSPTTILRAKNAGKLKAKKTETRGGKTLYSVEALKAWVAGMDDA